MTARRLQISLLLALAIVAVCTGACRSQGLAGAERTFDGGIVAGLNMCQVDGDNFNGYHKVGLNAGGAVFAHINKNLGLRLELTYVQKGCTWGQLVESPTMGPYFTQYRIALKYVEVPLALEVRAGKYWLEFGMSYARLLRSNEEILIDYPVNLDPEKYYFSNQDICYLLGASRKLYRHWYGNIRFQYSAVPIRPLERTPLGYSYGTRGQFNNTIAMRLEYWL